MHSHELTHFPSVSPIARVSVGVYVVLCALCFSSLSHPFALLLYSLLFDRLVDGPPFYFLLSSFLPSPPRAHFPSLSFGDFIRFYCCIVAKIYQFHGYQLPVRATSFVRHQMFYASTRLWTLRSINLSKRPIEKIAQSAHKHIFEKIKKYQRFVNVRCAHVYVQ